jgi:S-(hydroxymethyl)glutathione dehydrogenase/alcohol dehydrogenase
MSRTVSAAIIEDQSSDGFTLTDVEVDDPKPGEVSVEIRHAGACHTDWHAVEGDLPAGRYPVVGGHEGAGVVTAVGDGVDAVEVGDRVLTLWIPACGTCDLCSQGYQNLCVEREATYASTLLDGTCRFHRDGEDLGQFLLLGTFAEEVVVPERSVVPIPDELPTDVASIIGCGVATGYGSAVHRADIEPNDTAVVVGAGNVGLNAIQGAAHAGAGRIVAVDPVASKRAAAETFGATHTIDPTATDQAETVTELTDGAGADAAVFCVGVGDGDLIGDAYDTLGPRGELIVTATAPDDGIGVNPVDLITTEKEIKGCLYGGASPRRTASRLIDAYLDDRYLLDELITARYDLDEINEAYDALLGGDDIHSVVSVTADD